MQPCRSLKCTLMRLHHLGQAPDKRSSTLTKKMYLWVTCLIENMLKREKIKCLLLTIHLESGKR